MAVILVLALLTAVLPVPHAHAESFLGSLLGSGDDDDNFVRLDSLVGKKRTISIAYNVHGEVYRFSSYVTGGVGENSIIDYVMPEADDISIEIYTAAQFDLDPADYKLNAAGDLNAIENKYKEAAFLYEEPHGYLVGEPYEGGSVEDARAAFEGTSPGTQYKMSYYPCSEGHNYLRWTGGYVEATEEWEDPHNVPPLDDGQFEPEVSEREPKIATDIKVLTEGLYILVFKYEPTDDTRDTERVLRAEDQTRFLLVNVLDGNPNYPDTAAGAEEGYGCVILDPSYGYTTMIAQLAGDPVELASGSLNWSYTDVFIDGDVPLTFTRTYHSLDADKPSSMGYGWSHSYNYIVEDQHNDILLTLPTGGTLHFEPVDSGIFKVGDGNTYTLYRYQNGYKLTDESGLVVLFNAGGLPTSITDTNGKTTTITYTGNHINTVTNASGTLTFTYSDGHIATISGPNIGTVSYTYANGNLVAFTNADNHTIRYSYDNNHNMTQVVSFNGEVMLRNEYDSQHRVIKQTQPNLGTITYSYDDANRIHSYTTQKGLTYKIVMDILGRTTIQQETFGNTTYTTEYYYDSCNRLSAVKDRNNQITSYEYYDGSNLQSLVEYPDGTTVSYEYDEDGNVTETVQQDASLLRYVYENDLLKSSTDANGGTRTYHYNEAGHLIKSVDALGNVTNYTCNSAGLITSSTDPLGNKTQYEYDSAGRLVKRITPMGNEYEYV
jgi:YD repeat-containing protein